MKCELTDGVDVFESRDMSENELKEANSIARLATNSNLYWTCEIYPSPEDMLSGSYGEDGDLIGI